MIKRKGFTLIELLVVIAIVALLMAILVPVLSAARKQVQATVCMAALKQWGLCYQLYAADYDSKLPFYMGGTVNSTYMETLRSYYSNTDKMRACPAATKVLTGNPTGLQAQCVANRCDPGSVDGGHRLGNRQLRREFLDS